MPLVTDYGEVDLGPRGRPGSWHICREPYDGFTYAHGFGSQADAEIAVRILTEIGPDWDGPEEEIEAWCNATPFAKRMQIICEHLRW